jgi:hypothetical protein
MKNRKLPLLAGCLGAICLCGNASLAQPPSYASAAVEQAPSAAPKFPDLPPPAIGARALTGTGYKIPMRAGWNMVSFPFGHVTAVRGLNYALLRPRGSSSSIVDPTSQPRELDTRYGYWAYAAQPGELEVTGNGTASQPVALEPGWNLLGCPAESNVTVTQIVSADPSKPVAFDRAFGGLSGKVQAMPMTSGTVFQPGGTYWVYAYRRGLIQWQTAGVTMPVSAPPTSSLPRPVEPVARPSAPEPVLAAGVGGPAQLTGRVTDRQSNPVYKANVIVTGPQGTVKALTDTSGRFVVNVSPGAQHIQVLTRTCEPLSASVNVVPGANPPLQLAVVHRWSTIVVHMYSYDDVNNHYRPVKIEIWENDDQSYHYTNWYHERWRRYETDATWKPFPMGATYTVQVTWQDQNGNQQWGKHTGRAMHPLTNEYLYNSWT